jgi:ornithine carbamoyltransferase
VLDRWNNVLDVRKASVDRRDLPLDFRQALADRRQASVDRRHPASEAILRASVANSATLLGRGWPIAIDRRFHYNPHLMNPVRHFLAIPDFSKSELLDLFNLATRMKRGDYRDKPLAGKTLGMIFAKSSTRTRVSFEVGAYQLGGHALFLSSRDIQLGRGEPIRDTARVLSRYLDGIMIRTYDHGDLEELARYGSIPIINGLTDLLHPCQVLADLLTVLEALGGWDDKIIAWVGDGNNMANSWINAAGSLGFELRLACPKGYEPNAEILARNQKKARITLTNEPREAVRGAHVVNTDVWASMGQEEEQVQRARAFQGYIVDAALMKTANRDAIFLHCLPAHRGEEVAEDVIEGPQSRVWDEAENRLHVQKALMAILMTSNPNELKMARGRRQRP